MFFKYIVCKKNYIHPVEGEFLHGQPTMNKKNVNFKEDIVLCYEAIRYSSVKHNQVLLKFDYMFESKKFYN